MREYYIVGCYDLIGLPMGREDRLALDVYNTLHLNNEYVATHNLRRLYFEDLETANLYAQTLIAKVRNQKYVTSYVAMSIKVYLPETQIGFLNEDKLPVVAAKNSTGINHNDKPQSVKIFTTQKVEDEKMLRRQAIYTVAQTYATHLSGTAKFELRAPSSYANFFQTTSDNSKKQPAASSGLISTLFRRLNNSRKQPDVSSELITIKNDEEGSQDLAIETNQKEEQSWDNLRQCLQELFKDYHTMWWAHWGRNHAGLAQQVEKELDNKESAEAALQYLSKKREELMVLVEAKKANIDGSFMRRLDYAIRRCNAFINKQACDAAKNKNDQVGYYRDYGLLPSVCN